MTNKLNLWAFLLSASLASGAVLGDSAEKNAKNSIETTKENTFLVLSGKENMKRLRKEIEQNTVGYQIRKNDTIAAIADQLGINTEELVDLNGFLEKPLKRRGNNILIRPDQTVIVPKDANLFRTHIDRISEYAEVNKQNNQVLNGNIGDIEVEPIFASSVQSIGLPNCLAGFVESQKKSYDPTLPRVVDKSRETQVTCANAMRTLMAQCTNIADLSTKELSFGRKQNVDAWMLPNELLAIGYEQKFSEIMGFFDPQAIGAIDPRKRDMIEEYRSSIRAMNEYLEKNGGSLVGSYVPYYFKRSHYRDHVAEYNRARKDKHYNTHQSMFAGNAVVQFGAWNTPLIRDGKMETFGADKKIVQNEIEKLNKTVTNIQAELTNHFQKIISLSDPENNPEIAKKLSRFERVIEPIMKFSKQPLSSAEKTEKQERLSSLITEWNETKQQATLEKIQQVVPWYKITATDAEYFGLFISHQSKLVRYIDLFQKSVGESFWEPIDGDGFGVTIAGNGPIQQSIKNYNTSLKQFRETKKSISDKESLLRRPSEPIAFIDFLLNFVQSRADFWWALSDGYRNEIYTWLSIYEDTLHIKINGKAIDVAHELEIYKSDRNKSLKISPEDTVEITGPMMVDGEKQSNHPDPSRQNAMNIRTRFFFEFYLSESYLATELLSPGKNSTYARRDFPGYSGKLKIKWVYGLLRDETLEKVLKREITRYENLDPSDAKFAEKLRRNYALQIRALQIAGFLQDENTLNPGAVNVNRAIPYYSPTNINEVFSSFIQSKKQEFRQESQRLAEIKNFINIRTLPGDTYRQIFTSIAKYISSLWGAEESYPYIRELAGLPDFKKRIFVERFLATSNHEKGFDARKFLDNPKPYKTFILSLASLESILKEIVQLAYTPDFPWLSETDQKAIELVTLDESSRHMLANILAVEAYGDTGGIFSRRNIKKIAQKFGRAGSIGDYQIRIPQLLADLQKESTLDYSVRHLLRIFSDPKTQAFLDSFEEWSRARIEADLKHVETIRKIVADFPQNNTLPRKTISSEISAVMRFDEGDGSNVVGKIISASLLIDKLALHSEKLDYMLVSAGYELAGILDNPLSMRQYERTIMRLNNLPEDRMLLALAENFILRLADETAGTRIQTETVYDESVFSKGHYLGRINYSKVIFLSHLKKYRQTLNSESPNPKTGFFQKKLDALIQKLTEQPNNTNESIFAFLRDPELRDALDREDINPSLLPAEKEWSKDVFQRSVFGYVNKMDRLRQENDQKVSLKKSIKKDGDTVAQK